MSTMTTQRKLTKAQYIAAIESNIRQSKEDIEHLRRLSARQELTEQELEEAFAALHDALDMLEHYKKNMKVTSDELTKRHEEWLRLYMSDLILYGVGATADIRRIYDENLTSKTGNKIGGYVIQVRMIPIDRQTSETPLYNWNEVDRFFWDKDYTAAIDEYHYNGNLPYDDRAITYSRAAQMTRTSSSTSY